MDGSTKWKPSKGWLQDKGIPKGPTGDPAFKYLDIPVVDETEASERDLALRAVFSDEQIVYLVNKALYSLEYQRETHRKRAQAEQEVLGPIKRRVREMFGVSYLKATEEQIRKAAESVKADQNKESEQ